MLNWAWIADPRNTEQGLPYALPFIPYDYQVEFLLALCDVGNIHADKSRDVGLSWITVWGSCWDVGLHLGRSWKFFSCKQDRVDDGTLSSIFGKLRFSIASLPGWLFPPVKSGKLRLLKENDSTGYIIGESSNSEIARGERFSKIVGDEFSYMERSHEVYASVMAATSSFIMVGTPHGKFNKFGEIKFAPPASIKIRYFSFHWSRVPGRDQGWYEEQKLRYGDPVVIAQELDLDYEASVRGRIYDMFSQAAHVRSWKPSPDAPKVRGWDYGIVEDPTVCLWAELFSLNGKSCLFVYRELHDMEVKQDPSWWAEAVLGMTDELEEIQADYGDPAGKQRETDGYSYVDDLFRFSVQAKRDRGSSWEEKAPISVKSSGSSRRAGVMAVRRALNQGRLFFSDQVRSMIQAIAEYRTPELRDGVFLRQKEKPGEDFFPVHDWTSHFCDALRYMVINALPDLLQAPIEAPSSKAIKVVTPTSGLIPGDISTLQT
jgi:hypothetical protein